jgi:beta-galactosidase GanA
MAMGRFLAKAARGAIRSAFLVCIAQPALAAISPGDASPAAGHGVTFDEYSFSIDGKRSFLWSGELHPYRLPSPDLWRDILQRMKAAGFNATSIYFSWGYHSERPGVYDFTGVRDMDRLLDIAKEEGIYVIARPGPYINAELDSGGFPLWFTTTNVKSRSPDPAYLALVDEWLGQIDRIIARHQWNDGRGTVIAYQVENEYYDAKDEHRAYIEHLKKKARADGIVVPLVGNHNGTFTSGVGALDVDMADNYPQGFDCSNPAKWLPVADIAQYRRQGMPLGLGEFQGGAFDPWGGPGYDKCAMLINDQFGDVFYKSNIAQGVTFQNTYMVYGGTSWGWQAIPQNYTSYDYGAAITEGRQFRPLYWEDKRVGYFTQTVRPLLKMQPGASATPSNPALIDIARTNPDDGTQLHHVRHRDSTATSRDETHLRLVIGDRRYDVPQEPGTALVLNGRESKLLLANYRMGSALLRYSTSELMTHAEIAGRDIAILYGTNGAPGETLLAFARRPRVTVLAGDVTYGWAGGELRLNYVHGPLARVLIEGGAKPLLLLLGDKAESARFWRADTAEGPVLVRGSNLLRSASYQQDGLALTGDSAGPETIEIFAPRPGAVRWNGQSLSVAATAGGGEQAQLTAVARPVVLPALTWKMQTETPEADPAFDDSKWAVADKQTTSSFTAPASLPILFADDYGARVGHLWYWAHFASDTAAGNPTRLSLRVQSGGTAGAFSAWLNGHFLGSAQGAGERGFALPTAYLRHHGDNVLSVLTVNMGHEQDYRSRNENRTARGIVSAQLHGASAAVTWRIQGALVGPGEVDRVRGPYNAGGLYGERMGWHLPGYPDADWKPVSLPFSANTAGITWYRSEAALDLPEGQDTSVALQIADDPQRHYRAMIFVNGWQLGNYINDLGPQHRFPIPNGILKPKGANSIAIAVWNTDETSGGLGAVSLVNLGTWLSPLKVAIVESPAYGARSRAP